MSDKRRKRGPEPERVKIDEDWEEAIKKALRKERPKEGWPAPPKTRKSGQNPHSDDDSEGQNG